MILEPPSLISKSKIVDFERRDGGYDFIPLHLLFQNRHLYIMLAAAVRIKHLEKTLAAAVRIKHLATSCLQTAAKTCEPIRKARELNTCLAREYFPGKTYV